MKGNKTPNHFDGPFGTEAFFPALLAAHRRAHRRALAEHEAFASHSPQGVAQSSGVLRGVLRLRGPDKAESHG